MNPTPSDSYLCYIVTPWSLLRQAQNGPEEERMAAWRDLLQRYQKAVRAYLRGCVRDDDTAEDLFQEFCVRFLRGDFHGADPVRGSFRRYVKTALSRMVSYYRARQPQGPALSAINPADPANGPMVDELKQLQDHWKTEILDQAWKALQQEERESGTPYYSVLRLRASYPDWTAQQAADELARRFAEEFREERFRKLLQRARERFAEHIYQNVADTLDDPTPDRVEEELAELGLLAYCRSAAQRRRGG